MDVIVLDESFNSVGIADMYDSLIWTDRYNEAGDFEIATAATFEMISLLRQNYYLTIPTSDHVMIIEKIEIDSDAENGNRLIVSGRSLESILDRRIIWKQRIFTGIAFETVIQTLLNENIINPTSATGGSARKISNFIFTSSSPTITDLGTLSAQFDGDNLYTAIKDLCQARNIGFKITLDSSNRFVFQLYKGTNRSYSQDQNPYVVFSNEFDNLISSNYYYSNETYKNAALVAGEQPREESATRVYVSVGTSTGLQRREIYVDGSGMSEESTSYSAELYTKGETELSSNVEKIGYEGEVDMGHQFVYGVDFTIGDIVQIDDGYGHFGSVVISEIVTSENEEGVSLYPTFLSFSMESEGGTT